MQQNNFEEGRAEKNREFEDKQNKNLISNNVLFVFALFFAVISIFNFWSIYTSIPKEMVTAQATTTSIIKLCVGKPSSTLFIHPKNWEILNGTETIMASAINPAGNEFVKNVTFRYAPEGGHLTYIGLDSNDGDTIYNVSWDTTPVSDGNCIYTLTAAATTECTESTASSFFLTINNVDEPPIWNNYMNNMTTNFSLFSSWVRIPNATIGKPNLGLINFSDLYVNFDNADLDANVNVSKNNISIKIGVERCLNKPAILTLYNLIYIAPRIMWNSEECPTTVCRLISYEDGNLTFSVADFGSGLSTRYYAAENTSALVKIFDDTDNYTRYIRQDVKFYANFTTADQFVLNGTDIFCEISFNLTGNFTTPLNMSFNPLSLYYEYNRSFNSAGTFYWKASCNAESRELGIVEKLDNFTITNRAPILVSLIPNQTWLENAMLTGLDLNDYFTDPDEQVLRYDNTPVQDIAVDINVSIVSLTPRRYWHGNRTVIFYAYDPFNLSAESNEVQLIVIHVPPPPPATQSGAYPGVEPCVSNWSCTGFGPCLYTNISVRKCFDINFCEDNRTKPQEFKTCWYVPSCHDLIKNEDEEGVDCGGPCLPCPTCYDLIKNQGEEGVDCGGPCLPCPTCSDGIKNQGEERTDCGGPCQPCSYIEMPAVFTKRTRNLVLIIAILSFLIIIFSNKTVISNLRRIGHKLRTRISRFFAKMKKKQKEMPEEEQIKYKALLRLEALLKSIKKKPISDSAKELSFIVRVFFKEMFALKYEFTSTEFADEIKKTALDKNMKILLVSFFSKIERMEFSRFRIEKHELAKMVHQARTIIIALTKELAEIREKEKIEKREETKQQRREPFVQGSKAIPTKNPLTRIINKLFKPFSTEADEKRAIAQKLNNINTLLFNAEYALNSGRIKNAMADYERIIAIYNSLPVEEKENVHLKIINFYRRLDAELHHKNIGGKVIRKKLTDYHSGFHSAKRNIFGLHSRHFNRTILLLLLIAFSFLVPKILPFLLEGRLPITGYGFVCTGDVCFEPSPPDVVTYQGNETVIYVNVTNPSNVSINFTTTVDNPLFKSIITINKTTGKINFTPTNDQVGSHIVQIAVYNINTSGLEDLKEPTYTVLNVNDAPNITSWYPLESAPSVAENYSLGFMFNYTASDPDIIYGDSLSSFWYLDGQLNLTNQTNFDYYPDFCSAGYHNITVVVQDIAGLTDFHYWNANVSNVNRAPVFNKTISNYSWEEDSSITDAFDLDEYFYDLDNIQCTNSNKDNITYTATLSSGGAPSIIISIDSTTHTVTFSASANWCGQESIVFLANDSYNATQSNNVSLNVSCVADAPVLSHIGNQSARAEVNFVKWLNATDADTSHGDLLTFAINDTLLFTITTTNSTTATGLINFTPSSGQTGTYYFNISVKDSTNLEDFELISFTISPNNAPVLEPIADQSKYQNESFIMQLNATDPDGDNVTYSYATSNFPSFSISSSGLMSFSFVQADVGNHSVTVTATDSWGATNSSTFNFEVKDVNAAPVLDSINNKRAKTNHTFLLFINATDEDIGYGDSLIFGLNDTTLFNLSSYDENTSLINFIPTEAQINDYYLLVNVTDSKGLTDTQTFKLTVDKNAAPTINISVLNATENENVLFDLTTYTTDLDNDPLTYTYLLINETNTTFPHFNLTASGIIAFTSNKSDVGSHLINVTVSDGENSTSTTINFTIFEIDNPPVLDAIGNQTAHEDVLFTLQLNATDVENDTLEFVYAIINSTFPNFNLSAIGLINFTPASADVGNHTMNITVRQTLNHSLSDSEVILFSVLHVNHVPNITSYMPSYSNFSMYENQSIRFNHTSEDFDNDTLQYKWLVDSVLQNTSQNWTYTPDFNSAGLRNITLIVNDTFNITTHSWNVTVMNINRPPIYGVYSESSSGFANGTFNQTNLTTGVRLATNASYYSSGFFISQILDFNAYNTNYPEINFSRINYSATIPNGTSVIIGIRTSEDASIWSNWTYYGQNSSVINGTSNRYLQYMLNLTTNDTNQTPIVTSVSIEYAISNMSFPQNVNPWWVYLNHFFKDPDNENLTYNYSIISGSSILAITIANSRVQLKPSDYGSAVIKFNATDPYNSTVESNTILLNIEKVESNVPQIVSGGGGGFSTVIKEKIKETPYALDIIVPEPITMYRNDTIVAPIKIVNTGNVTLENIELVASSENKNLKLTLTTNKIEKLAKGEEIKTNLIIESYQTFGSYEVIITANVNKPKFSETNKIFVNSIELGTESEKELNTKIVYTQDLLASNPECLELTEFLDEAKKSIESQQYAKATQLLDSTIRSCKYLITEKTRVYEKPSRFSFFLNKNLMIGAGIIALVLILTIAIYGYNKRRFI